METVIFDCDGVLVDSEKLSCGAWLPVLARRGIHAQLSDIEAFIGMSDGAVLRHYRRLTGAHLADEAIGEKEAEYFRQARDHLVTFTGLPQVLDALSARGAALAVASSGSQQKIRFSLELTGLDRYFTTICSAAEVERGKPAPDLFLHTARQLDRDPASCVVVEDSVPGIQGARAAGMRALGFTSSHPASSLLAAGAGALFDRYADFEEGLAAVRGAN